MGSTEKGVKVLEDGLEREANISLETDIGVKGVRMLMAEERAFQAEGIA